MKLERKLLDTTDAEFDVDEKTGVISGYGSIFGNKDQGGDIVVKGAFAKSLQDIPNVKLLWGHDAFSPPIGVWEAIKEDERGLHMKGRLFLETERGREAHVALKAGAIDGLSIGYQTVNAKNTKSGRELRELKLFEVSVVNFPMNQEATVDTVKSMEAGNFAGLKNSVETTMRDAGFPRDEAKAAAAACADKVKAMRDAPDLTDEMSDFLAELRGLRA